MWLRMWRIAELIIDSLLHLLVDVATVIALPYLLFPCFAFCFAFVLLFICFNGSVIQIYNLPYCVSWSATGIGSMLLHYRYPGFA